jgi:hypothetical protein
MSFEKSKEFVESIYNFMEVLYGKAIKLNDVKLKQICKLIFNYLIGCCSETKLLLKNLEKNDNFNMKPVYDYITNNKIELFDFNIIKMDDLNISSPNDIERFVLSHIYYIYENN